MDSREHQAERALLPLLRRRRGVPILLCVGLLLGIAAAYWPVLGHQFLNYDDPEYVTANPAVRAGLNWAGIKWAFTTYHAGNWHPVTWLSHMLDVQLFGLNPGAHHLVNVLFHAANSLLLFLLLRRITGALWRSALVAALFAWHPLHVESVAWVAERKDVLSTFFFMLTLLAYAKYAGSLKSGPGKSAFRIPHSELGSSEIRIPHPVLEGSALRIPKSALGRLSTLNSQLLAAPKSDGGGWYALSLVLFALGLMSKPMLVTLPFVLLLLDFWPLGRLRLSTLNSQPSTAVQGSKFNVQRSMFVRLFLEKLPFFALCAAACVLTFIAQRHAGALARTDAIPVSLRVENAVLSYALYLWKTLWPSGLAACYPYRTVIPLPGLIAAVLVLAAILFLSLTKASRSPWLLVGWFWFLGMLVPVIGLVQVGDQAMADRYTYLSSIGLFLSAAWALGEVVVPRRRIRTPAIVLCLGCVALCLALSISQVRLWKDTETLFRHALAVTRDNPIAEVNLGCALVQNGNYAEAAQHFATAARVRPRYAEAHSDLGFALALQGQLEAAIAEYNQALAIKPIARTCYLLGQALAAQGKSQEAISHYRAALEIDVDTPAALNDLAWVLAASSNAALRNGPEAVRLAERACRLTQFQEPLFIGTLAAAYAEAGRFQDAVQTAQKALVLASAAGQAELAERNRQLLELYRASKAFHEN